MTPGAARLLASITGTPSIADRLAAVFDFDVTDPGHTPIEPLRQASGEPLEVIARSADGGTYFLAGAGPERPVLYADSESRAVLIADDLATALTIIIALPYWQDCLRDGDLEEVRSRAAGLEQEYLADMPDLPQQRAELFDALGLAPRDGVPLLPRGPGPQVVNEEGVPYSPLWEA